MNDLALFAYVWQRTARTAAYDRITRDERGEGVISAAIAVLVMAFLGVLMWQLFKGTLTNSNTRVNEQINEISSTMARADEGGAGVLGTLIGAGVFLAMMLFAVQVLVGLYTSSVVNAAAYDAAKAVAGLDGGDAVRDNAVANAQAQLGDYGSRVTFTWAGTTDEVVRLQARGPRPSFLPAALTGPVGLGDIVRKVTVRRESVPPRPVP